MTLVLAFQWTPHAIDRLTPEEIRTWAKVAHAAAKARTKGRGK